MTQQELAPPSPAREDEVFNLIYGCGNLESKLLLAGLLYEEEEAQTATTLANALIAAQGDNPPWPIHTKTVSNYCSNSFETYKLATAELKASDVTASGVAAAWIPNTRGEELTRAFVGLVGSWSLDHPAYSVQQLWGVASTNSHIKYPRVQHAIYEAILAASRRITTKKDLVVIEDIPEPGAAAKEDIREIVSEPLLIKRSSFEIAFQKLKRTGIIMEADDSVLIAPEAQAAVSGLVEGITALCRGKNLKAFTKAAEHILPDKKRPSTEQFRQLMAKGRQFSRRFNTAGMREIESNILKMATDNDKVTIEGCIGMLNEGVQDYGQTVGYAAVREALANLTDQGLLNKDPHYSRRSGSNWYTLK